MESATALERFQLSYRIATSGCWEWTRTKNAYGYSQFAPGAGNAVYGHRWSYEHFVGPIPDGTEIDHLCRVRHCVNPEHLEAVTHRTNLLRGTSPVAQHARRTHCPQGHEYTPENTYYTKRPSRVCRTCTLRKVAAAAGRRKALKDQAVRIP